MKITRISTLVAASGVAGENDPSFLRDPIPHQVEIPTRLEPPQGWVADSSIWKMVAGLANRLGYFDLTTPAGRMGRP